MATDPIADLRAAVAAAASELASGGAELPGLERPPKVEFGDYSTNAAMLLAPVMGESPRAVAEKLGGLLSQRLSEVLERVEVAGPGFLNLYLSDEWLRGALAGMIAAGETYGGSGAGEGERVLVEFVSANPTGPITVASGRHAAYGDALARILEFAGHNVEREFYVNDYGSQIRRLGESIKARARGEEPPEDGYHAGYVSELAERIDGAAESDVDELATQSAALILESVEATLERFRVRFDRFFSERSLHEQEKVRAVLTLLEEKELAYPSEGAVWMRTTEYGDDKDRVLMRSNGEMTYFAADIAYHRDKLERGYERAINVLGADHHGHVTRMLAAWDLLGGPEGAFELPIMQMVTLMDAGQRVQMSKRQGDFVTLDELLDDIGVDAARFFLLQRSHDTTLDLDLALARDRSQDNPVYYLQYAHARIASILRKAGEDAGARAASADLRGSAEQLHPSARVLLKRLLEWPAEILEAAERRAPHRITVYLHALAQDFTAFYRDVRVVGAAEEGGDEDFRLAMCVATIHVLARGLGLLGVDAPAEMHREDS